LILTDKTTSCGHAQGSSLYFQRGGKMKFKIIALIELVLFMSRQLNASKMAKLWKKR